MNDFTKFSNECVDACNWSKDIFQIVWKSRCHIYLDGYFATSIEQIMFYNEILTPKVEL